MSLLAQRIATLADLNKLHKLKIELFPRPDYSPWNADTQLGKRRRTVLNDDPHLSKVRIETISISPNKAFLEFEKLAPKRVSIKTKDQFSILTKLKESFRDVNGRNPSFPELFDHIPKAEVHPIHKEYLQNSVRWDSEARDSEKNPKTEKGLEAAMAKSREMKAQKRDEETEMIREALTNHKMDRQS